MIINSELDKVIQLGNVIIMLPDGTSPPFVVDLRGTQLLMETHDSNLVGNYEIWFKGCSSTQTGIYL